MIDRHYVFLWILLDLYGSLRMFLDVYARDAFGIYIYIYT